MKKFSVLLLTFVLILAAYPQSIVRAASAPTALGTTATIQSGAIYEISTEAELAHLAALVNGGQNCAGAAFLLTQDITVTTDYDSASAGNWTPIGITNPFKGTFYGQHHTVSFDLQYAGDCSGLFGVVGLYGDDNKAVIQDLTVAGSIVSGTNTGGIAGKNNGIIKNCMNSAIITDNAAAAGNANVGGIAGLNQGKIEFCSNTGIINGENYCGGISGMNERSTSNIYGCVNTAAVSGADYIGGISGSSPSLPVNTIVRSTSNCCNTGAISGNNCVGGIQGYYGYEIATATSDNMMVNCFNTGSVTGTANVGSLAGLMECPMQNCYWLAGTAATPKGGGTIDPPLCASFQSDYMLDITKDYPTSIPLADALNGSIFSFPAIPWVQDAGSLPYLSGITLTSSGNQYALPGGSARFSVDVTGRPEAYRWQVSSDNGTSWTDLTGNGADSPAYTTPAYAANMSGWQYHCIVSYPSGLSTATKTTAVAKLYAGSVPVITSQPQATVYAADGQAIILMGFNEGATVPTDSGYIIYPMFTTAAPGAKYMWYGSSDGGLSYGRIGSACPLTMSSALDGWMFYCEVSNEFGTVKSNVVTVRLCTAPALSAQPQSAAVATGGAASFSVTATGAGLSYQWQVSADGGSSWGNVSGGAGANAATYTTPAASAAMNGWLYRCTVTNAAGAVASGAATLTVYTAPVLSAQPQNAAAVAGNTASFSVTATGAGLSYQWQVSADSGASWGNVSGGAGANTAAYTTPAATMAMNGWLYRCAVTNAAGTVASGAATLAVNPAKATYTITAAPGNAAYGSVSGGGNYLEGSLVTVTAAAKSGYFFDGWYNGGALVSLSSSYTFTVSGSLTLTAQFDKVGVPASITAKSAAFNKVTVAWGAVKGAKGYQVYRAASANGAYKLVKTLTGRTFTDSGLKTGTVYYYKVRAYIVSRSKKVYGRYYSAAATAAPKLNAVTGIKAAKAGKGKVRVSWRAVPGKTKYEIWRSAAFGGEYALAGTSAAASFTDKKLTAGTRYYYKVRAYRIVGRVKVYGGFSSVTSAKP